MIDEKTLEEIDNLLIKNLPQHSGELIRQELNELKEMRKQKPKLEKKIEKLEEDIKKYHSEIEGLNKDLNKAKEREEDLVEKEKNVSEREKRVRSQMDSMEVTIANLQKDEALKRVDDVKELASLAFRSPMMQITRSYNESMPGHAEWNQQTQSNHWVPSRIKTVDETITKEEL